MSDAVESDELTVPVLCPVCDTTTRVPLDEAKLAVDRHNERLHDGESVATIDPALKDELARIVAEEMEFL